MIEHRGPDTLGKPVCSFWTKEGENYQISTTFENLIQILFLCLCCFCQKHFMEHTNESGKNTVHSGAAWLKDESHKIIYRLVKFITCFMLSVIKETLLLRTGNYKNYFCKSVMFLSQC